jgi:hypothetical protein
VIDYVPAVLATEMNVTPSSTPRTRIYRLAGLHLLLFAAVLALLFSESFGSGKVLFSNDSPHGAVAPQYGLLIDNLFGAWQPLYWLGNESIANRPNVSLALGLLLGNAVNYSKFFAPLCLLVLALCAWFCARQLGCRPLVCALVGLAAMLNAGAFSTACWGLPPWALAWAMTFLAVGFVSLRAPVPDGIKLALGGFAVGMGVMEGFDVGAIMSVFSGTFVIAHTLVTKTGVSTGPRVALGLGRAALVAVCAGVLAAHAVVSLIGTQVKGVAGMAQDEQAREARWNEATHWSFPKLETIRVLIPGLFGYRMDTPDGGQYWGAVGRGAGIDKLMADLESSDISKREQAKQAMQQLAASPQAFRYSGSGEYAGVLVVLVAFWAVLQSWRGRNSPFNDTDRRLIWFWTGAALVGLLLAYGRHAPFYQFIYKLPYFSTIRNPIKFLQPFHISLLILFAYGLEDLARRGLDRSPGEASLLGQLRRWWAGAAAFDRRWVFGLGGVMILSVLACLLYASLRGELIRHLQLTGIGAEDAGAVATFSLREAGWFVLFLGLSALFVVFLLSGALGGARAKWAGWALGLLLVADLSRANSPWILYENYRQKLATNAVIDALRHRPWEGRVSLVPELPVPALGTMHGVFGLWSQHHFPYHGLHTLDIPQDPREAQEKRDYRAALRMHPLRYWQLTSTRYLLGITAIPTPQTPISYIELLNQQLDPQQRSFRMKMGFQMSQAGPGAPIEATENANGPFALIEFGGALPRTKLFADWITFPTPEDCLRHLTNAAFDPQKTVILTGESPAPPSGATDPGTVEITEYTTKRIRLRAEAKTPCVLLLNDRYDEKWKVRVGGQPAELRRANFIARGVFLEPGAQEIEFSFEPPVRALYLTLAALAVGLGLCGYVLQVSRRAAAQEVPPDPLPAAEVAPAAEAEPGSPGKPRGGKRRKFR